MEIVAALAEDPSRQELIIRGLIGVSTAVILLVGSVYLFLALLLGPRLGYLVLGSCLFGVISIIALIWVAGGFGLGGSSQKVALGPKGPDPTWLGVAVGPQLSEVRVPRYETRNAFTGGNAVHTGGDTYDVSGYPSSGWSPPTPGEFLLPVESTTGELKDLSEEEFDAKAVLKEFVNEAIDPERKEGIADRITGSIALVNGEFEIVDIRFQAGQLENKETLIVGAKAVPASKVVAQLGEAEAVVARYAVEEGDEVTASSVILMARTEDGAEIPAVAGAAGKVIELGLRPGDKVKTGILVATLDSTGQPGAPPPVQVAGVRVIGGLQVPAIFFLIGSIVLLVIHLFALNRYEKRRSKAKLETPSERVPATV